MFSQFLINNIILSLELLRSAYFVFSLDNTKRSRPFFPSHTISDEGNISHSHEDDDDNNFLMMKKLRIN
jgi:hypothetical protein